MPSFAKRQRAQLRKSAVLSTKGICEELINASPEYRKSVRNHFKSIAINLIALSGDTQNSVDGFVIYGEGWLKSTIGYLESLVFVEKRKRLEEAERMECFARAAGIDLLKYHLLACLLRIEADEKPSLRSKQYILGYADEIEATINAALGSNRMSELLR